MKICVYLNKSVYYESLEKEIIEIKNLYTDGMAAGEVGSIAFTRRMFYLGLHKKENPQPGELRRKP